MSDCEEKAVELQKCMNVKKKYEKEHGNDAEFKDYMEAVAKYGKVQE